MYAGIDYSMTCPAITVGNGKNYKDCKTFFYQGKKKHDGKFGKNIYGMMILPYESQMERIDNLSEWVMSILLKFNVKYVTIEGYSMASSGRVFDIAENGGLVKWKMWKAGIEVNNVPPKTLKKFYTGNGNAGKELMVETFIEHTKVPIHNLLDCKIDSSPVADIADSHAAFLYNFEL